MYNDKFYFEGWVPQNLNYWVSDCVIGIHAVCIPCLKFIYSWVDDFVTASLFINVVPLGRVAPCNGLYGKAPPEQVPFSGFSYIISNRRTYGCIEPQVRLGKH